MSRRLRLRLHAVRSGRPQDEGFALIFALMFILLIGTFSLILLSQVTTEVQQTKFGLKHEQTVNTAGAGLNAGLNRIRNAVDSTSGVGVLAYLPCTWGSNHGSLAGSTDAAGKLTWQTTIYYLSTDPTNMTTAQVNLAAYACPMTLVPLYAYLVSVGHQAAIGNKPGAYGDRTLHATYQFATTNANAPGGQISYSTRCWDAGALPAVGTIVTFQTCLVAGTPRQSWYYRPDLTVFYQGDPSKNLCLDYRTLPTAPVAFMTLQKCIGSGQSGTAYNPNTHAYYQAGQLYQEFSSNYNGYTWDNVATNGDRDIACVNSYHAVGATYGGAAVGDQVVMTTSHCTGSAIVTVPAPAVGAGGAAGVFTGMPGPTLQLVSLAYFSRCLDVFSSDPTKGLIHYPCHQAPDPNYIEGNQQYSYSGSATVPGTLTTVRTDATVATGNYATVCFESGGTTISLLSCVPGRAQQQWTMTGAVPGRYIDSFLIKDYNGKCLTAGAGYFGAISLAVCNGSDSQKWNAPPGGEQSQLTAIGEL